MEDVERQGLSTGKKSTPGRIILLNGVSSSGKTVLARALQDRIEPPFGIFQLTTLGIPGCCLWRVSRDEISAGLI